MAYRQHIAVKVHACTDHILFTGFLGIACKNKAVGAIFKLDHKGVVITVLADAVRCQYSEASGTEIKGFTYRRILYDDGICSGSIHEIVEQIGSMYIIRAENIAYREIIYAGNKATDMILVIV